MKADHWRPSNISTWEKYNSMKIISLHPTQPLLFRSEYKNIKGLFLKSNYRQQPKRRQHLTVSRDVIIHLAVSDVDSSVKLNVKSDVL